MNNEVRMTRMRTRIDEKVFHVLLQIFLILTLLTVQSCANKNAKSDQILGDNYSWGNIIVPIDSNTRVEPDDDILRLYYHAVGITGRIDIKKHSLPSISEIKKIIMTFDFYVITKEKLSQIDGREALYVESVAKDDGTFIATYYIPHENVYASYAGPKENYKYFKEILESIRFTDGE